MVLATHQHSQISLGKPALIAGLGVLLMAFTVPIVEFYILPKLIDYKNSTQTARNIWESQRLFSSAIFIHFMTVICDLVITWALYLFLRPAHRSLALLVSWFRLVYTAFNISALLHLVQIFAIMRLSDISDFSVQNAKADDILLHVQTFHLQWRFGLVFFGVYLCALAFLTWRATYIPKFIGVSLAIAGLGYLIEDLKPFFYPKFDTGFLWFTFFGELVFMIWLLLKGSRTRIQQTLSNTSVSTPSTTQLVDA